METLLYLHGTYKKGVHYRHTLMIKYADNKQMDLNESQ